MTTFFQTKNQTELIFEGQIYIKLRADKSSRFVFIKIQYLERSTNEQH